MRLVGWFDAFIRPTRTCVRMCARRFAGLRVQPTNLPGGRDELHAARERPALPGATGG